MFYLIVKLVQFLQTVPACQGLSLWESCREAAERVLALRSLIVSLGKGLVLDGGVSLFAGLPVDGLVVARTIHGVDLAVLVGVGQAPGHVVDSGADQVLFEEERLGLGKGGITGVVVVDDLLALVDQIGELLKGSDHVFLVVGGFSATAAMLVRLQL